MTHMQPGRLRDAMAAAGENVEGLAVASGLRADRLDDVLAGRRRLGVAAMRALSVPLAVDWWALRCDRVTGQRPCPACAAPNVVTDAELSEAARAITQLLTEAHAYADDDVAGWRDLPSFAAARAALVAIGGDLDLDEVAAVAADALLNGDRPADLTRLGLRLAMLCGRGDVETEEIIGLDINISGAFPSGLRIGGWDLVRYNEHDLDHFDVVVGGGARSRWSWDRVATSHTWWLRRPKGKCTARLGGTVINLTEPREVAIAPLLALALVIDEPPGAISRGWAQKGCGVALSVTSRQLDYTVQDDGYVQAVYGPYRIDAARKTEWARHVTHVGAMVERVFTASTPAARRYVAAAEQFLAVSADLYHGWEPLPRLAVELSTVAEMLLLSGVNEGEVSRRVRIAAGWLGGIDDADRQTIHDFMKRLYEAGSKYRHGGAHYVLHRGDPVRASIKQLDVLRSYALLRRLMLHGLAVVDSLGSVAELCDRVQCTVAPRARLNDIITRLYADLALTPQRFHLG